MSQSERFTIIMQHARFSADEPNTLTDDGLFDVMVEVANHEQSIRDAQAILELELVRAANWLYSARLEYRRRLPRPPAATPADGGPT